MSHDDETPGAGVVGQLHALLVDALRTTRGEPFAAPVTVAEVYQELVPYRIVRAPLGLAMNADYEHVLVRMLSGESGLVRLEPAEAREELRRELESANPNVTLYRKFAGCDLYVRAANGTGDAAGVTARHSRTEPPAPTATAPHDAPRSADDEDDDIDWDALRRAGVYVEEDLFTDSTAFALLEDEEDSAEATASSTLPKPSAEAERDAQASVPGTQAGARGAAPGSPSPVGRLAAERAPDGDPAESARCAFCDGPLPTSRAVHYCPFCGADQKTRPCGACAAPLERDWVYCVECGTSAQ